MPQSRFAALLSQNSLPPSLIYLAPVLPIVQVMWADGRNQMPERAKLQVIIENHCRALSDVAGGMQVVSPADIELFDRTFIAQKPDPALLSPFVEVAGELLREKASKQAGPDQSLYQHEKLFQACLEIAATCPAELGDGSGDLLSRRIADEERRFIEKVFELLPSSS